MSRHTYVSKAVEHIEIANQKIAEYEREGGTRTMEIARHHREVAEVYARLAQAENG